MSKHEFGKRRIVEIDTRRLFELGTVFRRAIIQSDPVTLAHPHLHRFPRGACGAASVLLAQYLEDHKCGEFKQVLGNRHGWSHAWLIPAFPDIEDGFRIDITADQFDDQDMPVIVAAEHVWYSTFDIDNDNPIELAKIENWPSDASELYRSYSKILKHVPASFRP